MILADTSAWMEYDRGTDSPAHRKLVELIAEGGQNVAVTEPVLMEVLGGANDDQNHQRLYNLLTSLSWLAMNPAADFEGAARINRVCRTSGVAAPGYIVCMIANIAMRTESEILTADQDFHRVAELFPLKFAAMP
ncbi:MAG: PIN domain nuclease [Acidimicrobiia bacterium]|nr:PIN domain nuclease [bacterium]MXW58222.1 PIN domain nuclease [Acidimicrobiia bacterium]MXZ86743.1 PIN domain nuclease [Acidimicrobiia bacterium]MYB08999.1 PIN domain nuclease [Acidimicrobiia bacterium]MYB72856.1 PIN domain nuclease [Acidimicrobiia bacterium]